MFAHWPKPLGSDFKEHYALTKADEAAANAKYDTVLAGRALRRDFNIASNKRVRFVLKPAAPMPAHEVEVIRLLLNAEPLEVDPAFTPAKGTPTVLAPLGELFLPLEGLIDLAAERDRLQKEIAKVQGELEKVRAKLASDTFVSGAPAKVVEEHRQREGTGARSSTSSRGCCRPSAPEQALRLAGEGPLAGCFGGAQRGLAASLAAEFIEDRVRAIHLHLVHHAEQFAEAASRETPFLRKPAEIFHREIVDRHSTWRKVRGAELPEGHPRPAISARSAAMAPTRSRSFMPQRRRV
jgi:hypothetical protein